MTDLFNLQNKGKLIQDVIMYPLKINRDESGILGEVLKTNWPDIYGKQKPFSQCYYSVTPRGSVRDKDLWHLHPTKQEDRFVIIRGDAVIAICDSRKNSSTYGLLNLFAMGESNGDMGQYILLIPKNTLHGFAVVSKSDVVLLNFPTTLYDPQEEGRVPHDDAKAKFSDGSLFTWDKVLQEVKL